jgi:dihydrodipicolinate synthase/N-acetylneuraminate lyase
VASADTRDERTPSVRYRKTPSLITGSITPLVTPFDAEVRVDHPSLRSLVLHQQERIAAPTVRPPLAQATEAGIVRVQALLREAADLIDLETDIP